MSDDLDLMQLARDGDLLARVDDVDYRAVHVVLAWADEDVPSFYCRAADWLTTPAARLAEKDRAIAHLVSRVADLEARLTEQAAAHLSGDTEPSPDPGPCPDCGESGWKSARSLQMHRQRAHQGMVAKKRTTVHLADDDPGWRCAARGCTGAFTRSLTDPDFCSHHAVRQTNGVGVQP